MAKHESGPQGPNQFDPKKHVEFPDDRGSYVQKEALQTKIDAQKIANIANRFKGRGEVMEQDVMNILRSDADKENEARDKEMQKGEELLRDLQSGKVKYIHEFKSKLPKGLKSSKHFMMQAVAVDGEILSAADEKLRGDPAVVLEAVKNEPIAIRYATEGVKKDRKIAFAAVSKKGTMLAHLDKELQADKELVLAAVKAYGPAIKYANPRLQKDREVVLEAVKNAPFVLHDLNEIAPELAEDKEVIMAAVKKYGMALRYAPFEMTNDPDIVDAATAQDPEALKFAHPEIKKRIQEAIGITDEQIDAYRRKK